jgi:hypothetical protein
MSAQRRDCQHNQVSPVCSCLGWYFFMRGNALFLGHMIGGMIHAR